MASTVDDLSEDMIQEYKGAFRLFDKNGREQISTSELGTVMRSLGLNPTEAELSEMIRDIHTDVLEFSEFLPLMAKQIKADDSETDIKEAFKVFDKNNTGEISAAELKHVLTTIGEKLSEDEVEEMMKEGIVDQNGKIQYESFVKMMLEK